MMMDLNGLKKCLNVGKRILIMEKPFKIKTLKERYVEMMSNKISVSIEDLTDNEMSIIEYSYTIFSEKLEDIKILEDENRRISVELSNLKSYVDDLDNDRFKNNNIEN
jgi:hypothetical protein